MQNGRATIYSCYVDRNFLLPVPASWIKSSALGDDVKEAAWIFRRKLAHVERDMKVKGILMPLPEILMYSARSRIRCKAFATSKRSLARLAPTNTNILKCSLFKASSDPGWKFSKSIKT